MPTILIIIFPIIFFTCTLEAGSLLYKHKIFERKKHSDNNDCEKFHYCMNAALQTYLINRNAYEQFDIVYQENSHF